MNFFCYVIKHTSCRFRTVIAVVYVVLVLILSTHIFLENIPLENFNPNNDGKVVTRALSRGKITTLQFCTSTVFENTNLELSRSKGRHEIKRLIRIYDFYHTSSTWESLVSKYDICLTTQTSIERIYWLSDVLDNWTGPLSIAIYITSNEELFILKLFSCFLSKCNTGFQNQVSMHLAVPVNVSTLRINIDKLKELNIIEYNIKKKFGTSCPDSKTYLDYLLTTFPTMDKEVLKNKEVYPQNHMRNIARNACPVSWIYSTDIDIIPRKKMANMLQNFIKNRSGLICDKCAYVIPTFELKEKHKFPLSKRHISELFKAGDARQFHGKYYPPAHKATDYYRWITTNKEEGPVVVSHKINDNYTKVYEPFYISLNSIPAFDERFVGYGFTRNSQFGAAYLAGWKFYVLSPVFSIHWGLQSQKTILSTKKNGNGKNVRRAQTKINYILFKKILTELEVKKFLNSF